MKKDERPKDNQQEEQTESDLIGQQLAQKIVNELSTKVNVLEMEGKEKMDKIRDLERVTSEKSETIRRLEEQNSKKSEIVVRLENQMQ